MIHPLSLRERESYRSVRALLQNLKRRQRLAAPSARICAAITRDDCTRMRKHLKSVGVTAKAGWR
jgi:hypothetical protein